MDSVVDFSHFVVVQWNHALSGVLRVFKSMSSMLNHGQRIGRTSTRGNGSQTGGLSDRKSSLEGLLYPINSHKKHTLNKRKKKNGIDELAQSYLNVITMTRYYIANLKKNVKYHIVSL